MEVYRKSDRPIDLNWTPALRKSPRTLLRVGVNFAVFRARRYCSAESARWVYVDGKKDTVGRVSAPNEFVNSGDGQTAREPAYDKLGRRAVREQVASTGISAIRVSHDKRGPNGRRAGKPGDSGSETGFPEHRKYDRDSNTRLRTGGEGDQERSERQELPEPATTIASKRYFSIGMRSATAGSGGKSVYGCD